ncbi:MAG: ABC transporter permease [Deltaproteobacteria bacterium]|nr:ABC transporter permease [Deltaproteobacteria bacterium]
MWTYALRRLIISVPLLIAISFMTFGVLQLAPGNYFDQLKLNPQISKDVIERYEKQYHLDQPWVVQYVHWLKGIVTLDWGHSFDNDEPVLKVIQSRVWNTLLLSLCSIFFTWLFAIPIGIYCAVKQYKWGDKIFSVLSYIGLSTPNFFFALLLLYILGSYLDILPIGGMYSGNFRSLGLLGKIFDVVKHLIIPVFVISTASMAFLQRVMRGNMLEVLRSQYLMTARAKGLPENRVIYRHALRNAINPMITIFGYQLSGILSGAALTEIICSWPGIGSLMLEAVRSKDIYLVMANMLIAGVLLVLGNLIADILLATIDPRIRYG